MCALKVSPPKGVRRRGRPPLASNKDKITVTMRLRRSFHADLNDFAKKHDMYPGEVVMLAVNKYIERQKKLKKKNLVSNDEKLASGAAD